MRKIVQLFLIIVLVGSLTNQFAHSIYATYTSGGNGLLNSVNRYQNQASNEAARQQTQLQTIITRANALIATRLASLNTLNTRIQNDTNLSTSEKSTLSSQVQTEISGLNALQTKIDADTDVTTARSDTKTIITSYYIYEAFLPKIRLLIVLNNLQTVSSNLQTLVPQLQTIINTLQSQGKNVTQLQTLLNDISTQLTTINTTLTTDTNTIQNVTVSSGNSATFTQVRQDITQIVRGGLNTIKSDFQQMRPLFKQLIIGTSITPQAATVAPTAATTP